MPMGTFLGKIKERPDVTIVSPIFIIGLRVAVFNNICGIKSIRFIKSKAVYKNRISA